MPQSAGLIFTNDSGAGSGTASYVTDTLPDYTFPASVNTGFSSTISNNPLNLLYANTDLPQFGSKYLQIKDLILVQDRSQWISGKQTYQVIFYENFPQVKCFVFGNVQMNRNGTQASVLFKTIGDGISVGGVIRQVGFNIQPNSAAAATAQVVVDNVNEGTSIDFSSATSAYPANVPVGAYNVYVHNASAEAYGIHDIRLTANQASTMAINAIWVYFQNSGNNIDQLPGTSYVNKTKTSSSASATMALPSFGSSLGGNFTVYKTQLSGYTLSALSATTIASTASGSSGTNLLNLAVGTGASFVAGYGVIVSQGSSTYLGSILSMSTDTATMGTTIGFGISATSNVYTAWKGGNTLAINASLMQLAYSLDFSKLNPVSGFSNPIIETTNKYCFWGNNIGLTQIDGNQCAVFLGASGFMQMDGYFSAAEVETLGNAIWSATLSINGLPSWSQNAGQTGTVKKTIFTDAGPGWNSFNIGVGASMGLAGIQRVNMYTRNRDIGVSYGALADFDVCQAFNNRDAVNSTMMALGGLQRVYADQLYFKNTWLRGQTWTVPGGVYYQGASTNGSLTFQYFGQQFAVIGTLNTGTTLSLDGTGVGMTGNVMQGLSAALGWHTVSLTGGTALVAAIDYINPLRSRVDAKFSPVSLSPTLTLINPTFQQFLGGTGTYSVPQYPRPLYLRVRMVGGGGGSGGNGTSVTTGGNGSASTFGTSLLICTGGAGSTTSLIGGTGGTGIIYFPAYGLAVTGGSGSAGEAGIAANGGIGGSGGSTPFGSSPINMNTGSAATPVANTGCGAQGGAAGGGGTVQSGGGGGGGYVDAIVPNPATSYNYAVGSGGSAGAVGSGGSAAGATGALGAIYIEEYYQ